MANETDDGLRSEARPRRDRRLVIGVLIALALLAAIGLGYYVVDWAVARQDLADQGSGDREDAHRAFLADIQAGRLDDAYRSTTAAFQARVSREAFEARVRERLAFERRPDARGIEGGGVSGPDRLTYTHTLEDGAGNRLRTTVTVVSEDSILYRRPPPPRIEEYTVEALPPTAPGKP